MKTMMTLTLVCLFGLANAQSSTDHKLDSTKQMNLIDEQVKILNSVFEMGDPSDNPFGGATNYLQLLEQSDMDAELKEELENQYELYELSLDPKKKDSLRIVFSQRLQEAMEKSQSEMTHQ